MNGTFAFWQAFLERFDNLALNRKVHVVCMLYVSKISSGSSESAPR